MPADYDVDGNPVGGEQYDVEGKSLPPPPSLMSKYNQFLDPGSDWEAKKARSMKGLKAAGRGFVGAAKNLVTEGPKRTMMAMNPALALYYPAKAAMEGGLGAGIREAFPSIPAAEGVMHAGNEAAKGNSEPAYEMLGGTIANGLIPGLEEMPAPGSFPGMTRTAGAIKGAAKGAGVGLGDIPVVGKAVKGAIQGWQDAGPKNISQLEGPAMPNGQFWSKPPRGGVAAVKTAPEVTPKMGKTAAKMPRRAPGLPPGPEKVSSLGEVPPIEVNLPQTPVTPPQPMRLPETSPIKINLPEEAPAAPGPSPAPMTTSGMPERAQIPEAPTSGDPHPDTVNSAGVSWRDFKSGRRPGTPAQPVVAVGPPGGGAGAGSP
jgi:hypothetical protein